MESVAGLASTSIKRVLEGGGREGRQVRCNRSKLNAIASFRLLARDECQSPSQSERCRSTAGLLDSFKALLYSTLSLFDLGESSKNEFVSLSDVTLLRERGLQFLYQRYIYFNLFKHRFLLI